MQTVAMQPHHQQPGYGPVPVRRKPMNPGAATRPASQAYLEAQLGHSRARTNSSSIFPPASTASPTMTMTSQQHPSQYPSQYPTQYQSNLRRTPTSSTSSTTGTPNRSNSGALRRSSSTHSGNGNPTSYVALMRKQKATVWCDRAQYEDPRLVAAQQQAKMRAVMEVSGDPHRVPPRSASGGSSMAAGVRSKVRHHGVAKASKYAPVTYTCSGVPMRLSASEVDEGEEDTGSIGPSGVHQRTGSGRSSIGSNRRVSYANPVGRNSSNSTPPQITTPDEQLGDLKEEPTPMDDGHANNYLEHTKTNLSFGSGSDEERNFGEVGQMAPLPKLEVKKSTVDDLIRRGSVDERKATMSNTRLFIANPDLSD